MMNQTLPLVSIHRLVWTGLLAALTAVGALVAIPLGPVSPVPVTLQNMFVLLAGLILGVRGGAVAVLLYMTAGALGLPVFAGGKAGLAVFLGPTGGFMFGFLAAAMFCGLIQRLRVPSFPVILMHCAAGMGIILLLGTAQLTFVLDISAGKALAVGGLPFLPGDAIKCLAAAVIYRFLDARRLLPL